MFLHDLPSTEGRQEAQAGSTLQSLPSFDAPLLMQPTHFGAFPGMLRGEMRWQEAMLIPCSSPHLQAKRARVFL